MIFHVDANSFYASCERLFRPDLIRSPIAVLSNNDGIVIALNQECKDAGFKRGDAFYKIREELVRKGVAVFSSNYTLYADISMRLNGIYGRMCPDVEIYSIDESFLFFPDWQPDQLLAVGREIRDAGKIEVGIPLSVGVAPTKTLAKLCNKLAKKCGGVCAWHALDQEAALAGCPVGSLWGVGGAKAETLARHGVRTALDLKRYPLHLAKKQLTIAGWRTVQELNGIPAIDRIEREVRQNICASRSFAEAVYDLPSIRIALAEYTQEAVKRMREQKSACRHVGVFLATNPWSDVGEQYYGSLTAELPTPSSYLPDILGTAIELLNRIWRPGFRYRKVLVNLLGLEPDTVAQPDLFESGETKKKHDAIMKAFDAINGRYGRGTLRLGVRDSAPDVDGAGNKNAWIMKRNFLSPEYTTNLSDVPSVE